MIAIKRVFQMTGPPPPHTIRCGQSWEDADVLLAALDLQPRDRVACVCSGGDSALTLLGAGAEQVVAIDPNPDQIACLALRVAAYLELEYSEMLELVGSLPSWRRRALYIRARHGLSREMREYWDGRPYLLDHGIADCGRFEGRFRYFRERWKRWLHSPATFGRLYLNPTKSRRERFFNDRWNTWRWRLLSRVLFSRPMMERLGCDLSIHEAYPGEVAQRLQERFRHILTALKPEENPYLGWMLHGSHPGIVPWALRRENFNVIRTRLDRLEWHAMPIEDYLDEEVRRGSPFFDKFNLGDLLDRYAPEYAMEVLERAANALQSGGRVIHWNLLRSFPPRDTLVDILRPMDEHANALLSQDRVFFYKELRIHERK